MIDYYHWRPEPEDQHLGYDRPFTIEDFNQDLHLGYDRPFIIEDLNLRTYT